jgi:cytochrome c
MKKVIQTIFVCASVAFFAGNVQAQSIKVPADIEALLSKNTCLACHKADVKLIGPAYKDVAKKKYTAEKIVELIYKPQPSNWPGYIPMAAMTNVPKDEALKIAKWINTLAGKAKAKKK